MTSEQIKAAAASLSLRAARAGVDASEAFEAERLVHAFSGSKGPQKRAGLRRAADLLASLEAKLCF